MSPRYSKASQLTLNTCDDKLQDIFNEVIKWFDIIILCGYRNKERQNYLYFTGKSKVKHPFSKHNVSPSQAIDVAPYPIDWEDKERFVYMAGLVMGIAKMKGINLRWGGDWDRDTEVKDEKFRDLGHFELA